MYSNDISEELAIKMDEYLKRFDDLVPLMEIPDIEESELIEKINLSLETGKSIINFIPEIQKFYDDKGILS